MRLIGYARVSTEGQADNTSLDVQKERIQAYCLLHGHELVGFFSEVGSGKSAANRPMFQDAIKALGDADGLIATKLDRVARSTRDVLTLVEENLAPNNKGLILIDLQVDTSTPTGKMILTVMASVAELERNTIKERTSSGKQKAKQSPDFFEGGIPFGYQAVDGKMIPNEKEQEIIKIIKNHKRSGKSFGQIAKYLNENGIVPRRGKAWYPTTVKNVLDAMKKRAAKQ